MSPWDQHRTVAMAPVLSKATMPGSLLRGQTGSRPRGVQCDAWAHSGWPKPLSLWLFLPEATPGTPEGLEGGGGASRGQLGSLGSSRSRLVPPLEDALWGHCRG